MAVADDTAARIRGIEDDNKRTREDIHGLRNDMQIMMRDLPSATRKKMSENGEGGKYDAIRAEVDFVKDQFDTFRVDIRGDLNSKFSVLSEEIKSVGATVTNFINSQTARGSESLARVGGMTLTIVSIALGIYAYTANLQKADQDHTIAAANDRISTLAQNNKEAIKDASDTIKELAHATVPRAELDIRINTNRDAVRDIAKVQDTHSTQIATAVADAVALKADVERMKGDIVTRRENEGHWGDFQNRLNLLSNRVNDLAKVSGGGDLVDQLKQLRDQFNALQNKFINVPASK